MDDDVHRYKVRVQLLVKKRSKMYFYISVQRQRLNWTGKIILLETKTSVMEWVSLQKA